MIPRTQRNFSLSKSDLQFSSYWHYHPRAVRPTFFVKAVINTQRTNPLNFEFFDAVFWKSTN